MNWKQVALRALRWKLMLLGAAAGVWGGFLHESALLLPEPVQALPLRISLAGAALGLGLGLWLAPADALLRHFWRRAGKAALGGALLGAALGALGSAAGDLLQAAAATLPPRAGWNAPQLITWATAALTLGLIAAGSGLAGALVATRRAAALRRALFGLCAGSALAVPVIAVAELSAFEPWAVLASLALWGALLTLGLHGWERRRARRWLRLVTGPGEDDIFPLEGGPITLGKHERNHIPLPHFQEIHPYHCELRWAGDHYEIVDTEWGGVVLVNFRQVQEHSLKSGDLIKIGSALLQYGEAS